AQHRAAWMIRSRRHTGIPEDHQCLGDDITDRSILSCFRQTTFFQIVGQNGPDDRMVTNVVRCVAVRNTPQQIALVHVDRGQNTVRGTNDGQTLNVQATETATTLRSAVTGRWSSPTPAATAATTAAATARCRIRGTGCRS